MYGPDVSYNRTGASPPDSGTFAERHAVHHQFARTRNAPRVMDRDLSRMGLFILTSPYAGLLREEEAGSGSKGSAVIAVSAVERHPLGKRALYRLAARFATA